MPCYLRARGRVVEIRDDVTNRSEPQKKVGNVPVYFEHRNAAEFERDSDVEVVSTEAAQVALGRAGFVAGKDAQLEEAHAALERAGRRIDELGRAVAEHIGELDELRPQMEAAEGRIASLEGELAQAVNQLGAQAGELDEARARVAELEAGEAEREEMRARIAQLEAALEGQGAPGDDEADESEAQPEGATDEAPRGRKSKKKAAG